MKVIKFSIPEIIFGEESRNYAPLCARRLGAEKVFLVSDTGLERVGWVEELLQIFKSHNLDCVYYNDVVSNPRDYQVQKGAEKYLQEKADVIIALGGGSPMDAAKGIAIVASNGGKINDYEGANRIQRPLPPMVFLPTTAGSGADISQFAIITDTNRSVKMSIISRTLVPNISIIDPTFLKTKPKELVFTSAIDALCHAIESFVSKIASPLTELHSIKAIELIVKFLPIAARTLEPDVLKTLSIASTLSAMSFSNAGLGAVHALAHSIGGIYDVPHGSIHSVLLPSVMRFNIKTCPDKIAKIGEIILGRRKRSVRLTAFAGIEMLRELFSSLNMKTSLREILLDDAKIETVCKMAIKDVCAITNPRPISYKDFIKICEEAW